MRLYDYAPSCNCYKVRLLLAQLRLKYERVPIDIFDGDTLTDDYATLKGLSKKPWLCGPAAVLGSAGWIESSEGVGRWRWAR